MRAYFKEFFSLKFYSTFVAPFVIFDFFLHLKLNGMNKDIEIQFGTKFEFSSSNSNFTKNCSWINVMPLDYEEQEKFKIPFKNRNMILSGASALIV